MSRRITVQFIGDASSLNKATDSAVGATGRLSDKMRKVAKVAGFALGAGAVIAAKGLYEATKAAAADEASQARLKKTLENTAKATDEQVASVEDWISAQGRAKGFADDELRPAMEKLVTATKDVGKAQDLASLAMDISAGTGKSLESVSLALAKAQNGNIDALGRLGIATKDASGKTLTFDKLTKNLGKTFGGQAATKAETLQGKVDRLKLIFDETKETIGSKLIPVVSDLASWFLNKGIPAISAMWSVLKDKLGPVFKWVGDLFKKVSGDLSGDASKNFGMVKDIVRGVVDIVKSLWSRFGENIIAITKSAWGLIRSVIGGALRIIRGVVRVVSGLLKGDWGKVWAGIKDILRGALQIVIALVKNAANILKAVWKAAWGVIRDLLKAAWGGIKGAVSAGADRVVDVMSGLKDRIVNALKALPGKAISMGRDIIGGLIDGIRARAGELFDVLKGIAKGALESAKDALGIHSPSREFARIGSDSAAGLVKGWDEWAPRVKGQPARLVKESLATAASVTRASSGATRRANGSDGGAGVVVVNEIIKLVVDGRTLAQTQRRYERLAGV
mgnify:FL=1